MSFDHIQRVTYLNALSYQEILNLFMRLIQRSVFRCLFLESFRRVEPKESQCVLECLRSAHDHRVCAMEHDVLVHALDFGVFDRDFSIIFTRDHSAVERVDAACSNGAVYSVARSTLISGCYAPRVGAQFHRAQVNAPMPSGLKAFPAYLKDAGYHTTSSLPAFVHLP